MEPKEKQKLSDQGRSSRASFVYSPVSSTRTTYAYRNSPSWPNEWGAIYNESESSDWLSQSVASSTSWSDEFEGDLTKHLQEQMKLVENTLYKDGNNHLPARNSLKEECKLWQQNFPHLRVVGEAVRPSVGCQTRSRQEEIEEQIDEIIAAHGDYEEESPCKVVAKKETSYEMNEIYKEKIKKAVIDQIFARIWPEIVKKIEPALRKATKNQGVFSVSPELGKYNNSLDDELTSGFNSLSLVEDVSLTSLRTRSGRKSALSARKNYSAVVPVKPVVIECSIPVPSAMSNRTSSAFRRSPAARLSQPSLSVKLPSPERLLSPMVVQSETRHLVKSAGGRKVKNNEKKPDVRPRPQYDAMTGRMISRDETRSGLRRNLKTSPPLPWSRHVTLPPIETYEITPKKMEPNSKRSNSAFFKGGRLNSGSRPNTSLAAKNQVVLTPLDSLQIRQTSIMAAKQWVPDQHSYINYNCETLHLKHSDQRQRWRNRSNIVRK